MKRLIYLFIFVILCGSVSAVKPITNVQLTNGNNLITIEYPKIVTFNLNKNNTFHFHIYNSTGYPLTNTTDCNIHIYDLKGGHIANTKMAWDSTNVEYGYVIHANTIINDTGSYQYIVWCNNTKEAGFVSTTFDMIKYDDNLVLYNDYYVPSCIALCILISIGCLWLGNSLKGLFLLDKYNAGSFILWVYALINICAGMMIMFEALSFGTFYHMMAYWLYSMLAVTVIIFIYFIFMFAFTMVFKATQLKKQRKEER